MLGRRSGHSSISEHADLPDSARENVVVPEHSSSIPIRLFSVPSKQLSSPAALQSYARPPEWSTHTWVGTGHSSKKNVAGACITGWGKWGSPHLPELPAGYCAEMGPNDDCPLPVVG